MVRENDFIFFKSTDYRWYHINHAAQLLRINITHVDFQIRRWMGIMKIIYWYLS